MARSVKVGRRYEVTHYTPMWPGPQVGTIVKVVNLPGGAKDGTIRNVEDAAGNIYFVHVSSLQYAGK